MAVKDIRSGLLPELALFANVVGNGDSVGAIIDTAKFDLGLVFDFMAVNYQDGTYTPKVEEDDDIGFSSPSEIEAGRLIGSIVGSTLSAETAQGGQLPSLGVFGNKRFIRLTITASSVTNGADIAIVINKAAEVSPAVS